MLDTRKSTFLSLCNLRDSVLQGFGGQNFTLVVGFAFFYPKILERWQGPMNGILLICECSLEKIRHSLWGSGAHSRINEPPGETFTT